MQEQIGFRALRKGLIRESERWAQTLPQMPRLLHQALAHAANQKPQELQKQVQALARSQRQTRAVLWVMVGLLAAILVVVLFGQDHDWITQLSLRAGLR